MTTSSAATIEVDYRAADLADSRDIARFLCMAGGGVYEFLFDDLVPLLTAVDLLSIGIASERCPISFRNCLVAVDRASREIVGAANVFPADLLKDQKAGLVPAERYDHVRSLVELQDWGSMFLNAMAVSETCRGQGVGTRLLDWARTRAADEGFDRLSLHVWADNVAAVRLYKAHGFVALGIAPVASHPRLAHTGGSILMRRTTATSPRTNRP